MTHATIIAGATIVGQDAYYLTLIDRATYLIAADSGAVLCRTAGRVPDLLVGDFDSVPPDVVDWARSGGADILAAPRDKDVTDLDLALDAASDRGVRAVTVSAAWSGRLDHTLASFGSIARTSGLIIDLADPGLAGWVLRPDMRSTVRIGPVGAICSLFAMGGPAMVSTVGMRYELSEDTLLPLSAHGLSNVVTRSPAEVQVLSGVLVALSNPLGDGVLAHRTNEG